MKYPRKFGYLSPPGIQIEFDSLRHLGVFRDTFWIVGPLGQAICVFVADF